MVAGLVTHADISRALADLGERAGAVEVAEALRPGWEPFSAQMRRRIRTRSPEYRDAYLCLARAGEKKVRLHLEVTGVIPRREGPRPRRTGLVIRVRGGRRRRRGERRGCS